MPDKPIPDPLPGTLKSSAQLTEELRENPPKRPSRAARAHKKLIESGWEPDRSISRKEVLALLDECVRHCLDGSDLKLAEVRELRRKVAEL